MDKELEQYRKKALYDEEISEQSLDQYLSRLKTIKEITGHDLVEFTFTEKGGLNQAKEKWLTFRNYLKNNYPQKTCCVFVAALLSYLNHMGYEYPKDITFIDKKQFKLTNKRVGKSKIRKIDLSSNVNTILDTWDQIFHEEGISDKERFLVAHMFYACNRKSEARLTLVKDYIEETPTTPPMVVIRSEKTEDIFTRPVWEKEYWNMRKQFVKKNNLKPDDYLFQSNRKSKDGRYLPLSLVQLDHILNGYYTYDKLGNQIEPRVPGILEKVWGSRAWSHCLRHSRTNDYFKKGFSVEDVKYIRKDAAIQTTLIYRDDFQQEEHLKDIIQKIKTVETTIKK